MSTKEKIYYLLLFVFCVASVVLAIRDFTHGLSKQLQIVDWTIYGLFVADYIIRLIMAESKKTFFKENIIDLIAILPFNSLFRALRLLRFVKLLRMVKLLRLGAVSSRFMKRSGKFIDTNGFKYILAVCAIAILLAATAMTYLENMDFPDALWWSFVTATTVGYGDISPSSGAGRIVAALLMLVGIGLIGSLTSTITSFFLKENQDDGCSNEKIDMVMALYEKLNDEEKEAFKSSIE